MKKKMDSNKMQKRLSIAVVIIGIIAFGFLSLVNFIADWLWFQEMGYTSVFFTKLVTQLQIGIPMFLVLVVLLSLYLIKLRRGYFKKIATDVIPDKKKMNKTALLVATITSLVVTLMGVPNFWFSFLQYTNASDFDITDPLFNQDLSFYIFKVDFLRELNGMLIGFIILMIVMSVVYYMLLAAQNPTMAAGNDKPDFENQNTNKQDNGSPFGKTPFDNIFGNLNNKMNEGVNNIGKNSNITNGLFQIAAGQLSILAVALFVSVAINYYLMQFDILQASSGVVYGAGYVHVNVQLWVYRIIGILAVVAAITVPINIFRKKFKSILVLPVVMILVNVIGVGATALVQEFVVSPDELNKEEQYIANNITYTQSAYQLDNVTIKTFAADNTLTSEDIANNSETISNIRINDYQPVQTFYNQTQSIRNYYTFKSTDVDRYMINGKYTQTYLSAREIDETKIEQTWLNQHIKYTHGYGIALSRVDAVTPSGQPDVMIKNIPPESNIEEIQIDRPEIYFGESTNNYILTNTDEEEFDYPDGDTNQYTTYAGDAGIPLTPFNRLVFAIKEGSTQLLVSSNINSDSKIIIHRDVMDRVTKIMPYLTYENDPYIVAEDGKLYWIIDAYTMSANYPYSEPYEQNEAGINYIRNSVKVVVDAYNGDVDFYIADENDPIIETYSKIYPDLFKSIDEMPAGIRTHIKYPNTLLNIQASIYARYHMSDVNVFYQNEDIWDIATQIYGTETQQMTPNYFIFKLPGEEEAEFVNSIPYTPRSKQNMTALFLARNDGEHYGELVLYSFPKNKTIPGPMQIEAAIDQNTEISGDFTLWQGSGSTYSRGNLFIVPIESSLLYIEPIYLEASASAIPEVKRIVVAYDDKIAYEETLAEALASLFGEGTGMDSSLGDTTDEPSTGGSTSGGLSQSELIQKAAEAYDAAIAAQQNGDWAQYGEYMEDLEEYLSQLTQ